MNMLCVLPHPAFCIRQNGTLVRNEPANHIAPSCSAALPQWLGNANAIYELWDRNSNLQLTVMLQKQEFLVTVYPLCDGTLFIMAPNMTSSDAENALAVTSQVMRMPLTELSALIQRTEQTNQYDAPAFNRALYRMTRIVSNLTESGRLNSPSVRMNVSHIDTQHFFTDLLEEAEKFCRYAQRKLTYSLPKKGKDLYADPVLIKRAVLNLISNALKFSPADTPICCRIEIIGTHLVFQVENTCTDNGTDLLRAAFSRLSQRRLIPDPKWGIGLGLPIASTIARLHGGMIAVETQGGTATVSLSLSLRSCEGNVLSNQLCVDYTGGMRQTLLELSDVLPVSAFE